jgi:hypothetical protein
VSYISIDEFVSAFKKVNALPLFTWVPKLIEGYSKDNMNMDESGARSLDMVRKLTVIQNDKTRSETESMGFVSTEYDNMQEFFNKELKKTEAKEVLQTIQKMFKDIRSSKLKRYFVEALTKHVRYLFILKYRKESTRLQVLE